MPHPQRRSTRRARWTTAGLAAALVCAMGVGLTACGGSDDSDSGSAKGDSSAGSAVPDTSAILKGVSSDPSLAKLVPASLTKQGVLDVGSNVQSPPGNFYSADGKTPIGFEVDLITAIGNKLGLQTKYHDMDFNSLITSLQSERIAVTIAGMNDTPERAQKIDFVDYFNSGITMMVQKGNPQNIKSTDDLCGKSVAVVIGTSQQDFAKRQSASCVSDGKSAMKVTDTDSDSQNQTQLRTGRVAAILNDLPSAVYISRTAGNGDYFQTVDQPPIDGGPYGIGVNKKNSALTGAIEKALQSLIDDGTYGKILSAWDVKSGALTKATVNAG